MAGQALCGSLPFSWKTDFVYEQFGGWMGSQGGHQSERDILVVIPGKNRNQAIILADHYDTAYMEDLYEKSRGGSGARKSARRRRRQLLRHSDIAAGCAYLSATGSRGPARARYLAAASDREEFPADSLGARHFTQTIIEKTLKLQLDKGQNKDLSNVRLSGIYVMDMIAHNRDTSRDIFQISPGCSAQSLALAMQAHLANRIWNESTYHWNRTPEREKHGPGKRSADGNKIPDIAQHLRLSGEVRTKDDLASSLFNNRRPDILRCRVTGRAIHGEL